MSAILQTLDKPVKYQIILLNKYNSHSDWVCFNTVLPVLQHHSGLILCDYISGNQWSVSLLSISKLGGKSFSYKIQQQK